MKRELTTEDVLAAIAQGKVSPVYLVWGEEFLVRKSADEIVKALVPDASAGLNLSVLDGGSPREVASDLATLPLFPGPKVVLTRDPEFVAPKKGRGNVLGKALDAWRAGRRKEAARRVLAIAARAGWGVDQLDPGQAGAPSIDAWREELSLELAEADVAFLREVAAFCRDERITAPESDTGPLLDLLEKGVPKGQALVIAATDVDAKNPLVKWAQEKGAVVERKVAAKLKDVDLKEVAEEILAPLGKRLAGSAEAKLKDRVGGNMRLLQSELEKLAAYAEGKDITAADVELLVARAREDEFMELANALQGRDLGAALRYVDDQLTQGVHGLQLLGAVASIVRGLLENRERLTHLARGVLPRTYPEFTRRLLPEIEAEIKARKGKMPHPYGMFAGMQAASRFSRGELLASLSACAEADLALKSSASSRLVIERLLWTVCGAAR